MRPLVFGDATPPAAPPFFKPCNYRWNGETQVQQCTLHARHIEAIDEWAERGKAAKTKLKERTMSKKPDPYASEEDTAELLRVGQLPKPLRLAAMLEKTMQWPLHGKSADCLREMYELMQRCENEMRYAEWDKLEADNPARNGVYQKVKSLLEKNT